MKTIVEDQSKKVANSNVDTDLKKKKKKKKE